MKLFIFVLLSLLKYIFNDKANDEVFIQDKVRFGSFFLQYGRFFESFLMILDLYQSDTYLFSNMNKKIAEETQSDIKTNNKTYISNIELNGIIVKDFKFKVKEDRDDRIDENDINGIIGLGIDDKGGNVFMDRLRESGFINKRIVFITIYPFCKLNFLFDMKKSEIAQYQYCNPITTSQFKWNCPLSHIKFYNEEDDDFVELPYNTISIFTPRNMFNEVPYKYFPLFKSKFELEKDCNETIVSEATILVCDWSKKELSIHYKKNITVVINGIGITIKGTDLFQDYDSERKMFMFSFKKTKELIWNFGFSFVYENSIALDFDNKRLGFRRMNIDGEKYENYTEVFNEWIINNRSFFSEGSGKYFVFGFIQAIIIGIIIIVIYILVRRYKYKSQARSTLFNKESKQNQTEI